MSYKLSERFNVDRDWHGDDHSINYGKLANLFFVVGLVSLLTAWAFSSKTLMYEKTFLPRSQPSPFEIGPLYTKRFNTVFHIEVEADLPLPSWSFVEGQVLDKNKNYLFAFGQEFWHEQGRDSDGYWRQADDTYSISLTLPEPQTYYLSFDTSGNTLPNKVKFTVSTRMGSSIPHLWFGILLILIGIVLNEKENGTIRNIWGNLES